MTEWLEDNNGNKCSVEYFGSRAAAQKALDSLINCKDCINCSDCSYCLRCSDCSGCSRCLRCSDCSGCSDCSDCLRCSDCSGCSDCSDCLRCSYCSRCLRCSDCSGCSDKIDDTVYPTIPKIDNIHRRIFEAVSQPNALDMEQWHSCNTTHCRAGWVVHLAGEAGYALEGFHNTALAAQLIYRESGYRINPCRFYDTNEAAMADMQRLAEEEAKAA